MSSARARITRGTGRALLIDAALELIVARGLHAITLRAVADHAGVSLGSTTYHFTDRERLLEAALEWFAEDEIARCAAAVETWRAEPQTHEGLMAMMFDELKRSFAGPRSTVAQMELYVEASRNPRLSTAAQKCILAYQGLIGSTLELLGVDAVEAALRAERIVVYTDGLALQAAARGGENTLSDSAARALWTLATTTVDDTTSPDAGA